MHTNCSDTFALARQVDPFLQHQLERMKQKHLTVQTTNHTVHGVLVSAHPDFIVLHVRKIPLYVRSSDIVRIVQGTSLLRPVS